MSATLVTSEHRPSSLRFSEQRHDGRYVFHVAPRQAWVLVPIVAWGALLIAATLGGSNEPWTMFWPIAFMMQAGAVLGLGLGVKRMLRHSRVELDGERFSVSDSQSLGPGHAELTGNLAGFSTSARTLVYEPGRLQSPALVVALTHDGRTVPLPVAVDDHDQAEYVAARLNAALTDLREPRTYRG